MSLHVTVLVSGIVDPKWPLSALGLGTDALGVSKPAAASIPSASFSRKLSPFDEAAIECALKLRDSDAGMQLHFIVACEDADETLMRTVAAFRPDRLQGLAIPRGLFWDAQALAQQLAKAIAQAPEPADLILVGREFGDFDEGTLAPCLAEALDRPFVGLVQEVRAQDAASLFVRERNDVKELIRCDQAVVASVTNAKSNRLRHPLMKNVMAAKRERLDVSPCDLTGITAYRRPHSVTEAVAKPRGDMPCQMLTGSANEQAQQLTDFLSRLMLAQA